MYLKVPLHKYLLCILKGNPPQSMEPHGAGTSLNLSLHEVRA